LALPMRASAVASAAGDSVGIVGISVEGPV
jgi:hypothetical protein